MSYLKVAFVIVFGCLVLAFLFPPEFFNVKKDVVIKDKYPPLTSYIGGSVEGVETSASVKQINDKYEYTYVLKNVGKRDAWLAGSSVVDMAILGPDEVVNYYILQPGQSSSVTFLSSGKPVECSGHTIILTKGKMEGLEYISKERGISNIKSTGAQTAYSFQMRGKAVGWIPEGLVQKNKK